VEVNLTAEVSRVSLLPGKETEIYSYNGGMPGPTLEVREGDNVIVHFRNNLPARDTEYNHLNETTIHWHGIHLPEKADGNPMDPVQPGGSYDYVFTVHQGTAGTFWYHPHPHHITATQVARGLFGALIVRPAADPLAGIPEKVLILSDNRFYHDEETEADIKDANPDNQQFDLTNGREGDYVFVNRQLNPTIAIRSGEIQRWRIINASGARFYRLNLPGHTILHVANDAGLFERAVETPPVQPDQEGGILVAPSERVEILVRGTGEPGSKAILQSLPYDRYKPDTRPKGARDQFGEVLGILDWDQPIDLLTLQYTDETPVAPVALPESLRPVAWLRDPTTLAVGETNHTIVMDDNSQLDVNGQGPKSFEIKADRSVRIDITSPFDATEIWTIVSKENLDHPFHLHGFSFQVLDRGRTIGTTGQPDWETATAEPFPSWKDTVNIPGETWARFIIRYTNYPGRRMFHCHILNHEDHGMMGVLEVLPPRSP
jgi:bilirubin oxidase